MSGTPSRRASVCASDMVLWTIWEVSLALAATSIIVMLALVLRRMVQMRIDARTEKRRTATSAALLAFLDGSADQAAVLAAAGGRSAIVGDVVFRMREIVRGEDAVRLVAVARSVGEFERTARRLRHLIPAVRAAAARRLAIFGADAVPELEARLRDEDLAVRMAAAIELTEMGNGPSLDLLAEALSIGDGNQSEDLHKLFRPAVAADVARAIRMLEDEWMPDALRLLLIDGLGHAGALQALPALSAVARNGSSALRAEALRALALLGHPGAASIVIDALADERWWVRAQAANTARRIGIVEAIEPLCRLLDDEHWWVRFRAAEALSDLGGEARATLTAASRKAGRAGEVAQLVLAEKGVA